MARLWIAIEGKKKVWKIPASGVVIGGAGAQLKLQDPAVADQHCKLEPAGDGWRVKLLDEEAMMLVGGESVAEADLSPGDVITIGDTEIHFEEEAPAPASPPPRPAAGRSGGGRSRRGRPAADLGDNTRVGSARRDRYRKQQSLPGWATGVIAIGVVLAVVIFGYLALSGLPSDVKATLEGALAAARSGDFDKAYAKLDKVKDRAPRKIWDEYKAMIDKEKLEWETKNRALFIQSMFDARVKKYSESGPVLTRKPINVFQLLIRCEVFQKNYPDSKWAAEAAKIAANYRGVVDMNNPDPSWLVTAVHDPYYKSQHHKKFYLSFQMIDFLRQRYGSQHGALLDDLYAQTLNFERMWAEREFKDAAALIDKKSDNIPLINEQIKNLNLVKKYAGHQEWKDKAEDARAALQKHKETLFK